jgi:hypothetical protein
VEESNIIIRKQRKRKENDKDREVEKIQEKEDK